MEAPATAAALSRLLRALGRRQQRLWSAPWPQPPARLAGSSSASLLRGTDHRELCERAAREPGPFWGALARETLLWDTPHHTDCEWDFAQGRSRWFLGGRLNVAGKKRRPWLDGRAGSSGETFPAPRLSVSK